MRRAAAWGGGGGGGGGRTVNYDETQPKSQGSVVAEEELEPGMGV